MRAFKIDSEKNVCGLVSKVEFVPQTPLAVSTSSRLLRGLCLFLPYFSYLVLRKAVVVTCHNFFYFCHKL